MATKVILDKVFMYLKFLLYARQISFRFLCTHFNALSREVKAFK